LVRDRIPEIIAAKGQVAVTHLANPEEYHDKLHAKLLEECQEFLSGPCVEEVADILDVVQAICELHNWSFDEVQSTRVRKIQERGGFTRRIILDEA
jgi:predicted house-cleaning noncanonical NTP pyrophosphatase (MazG superfamily)